VTAAPDPEPVITYESRPAPAMQFAVNFGVFAGREVTRLELGKLAHALLELVPAATILSEQRVELDRRSEALLHQVRVEIPHDALPADGDVEGLRRRLAALLTDWASSCITGFSGAVLGDEELAARDAVIELTSDG
jgi:hypothetical protein